MLQQSLLGAEFGAVSVLALYFHVLYQTGVVFLFTSLVLVVRVVQDARLLERGRYHFLVSAYYVKHCHYAVLVEEEQLFHGMFVYCGGNVFRQFLLLL